MECSTHNIILIVGGGAAGLCVQEQLSSSSINERRPLEDVTRCWRADAGNDGLAERRSEGAGLIDLRLMAELASALDNVC